MNVLTLALFALGAYLVGAVPFGYLTARAHGIDIRTFGSGNIGATNVGRALGKRYFFLVFFLDFAKGALPVLAATWWAGRSALPFPAGTLPVTAGVAGFLGHLFPVYLGFRGGKGVATGAGVVAVLVPGPMLLALLVWLAVFVGSRHVAAASILGGWGAFAGRLPWRATAWERDQVIATAFCLVAAVLITVRHHDNLRRLIRGTEYRFQESTAMLAFSKTLHVLALGLWFGTVIFFTFIVGLVLITTFETVAERPAGERPDWLPMWEYTDRSSPDDRLPDPPRKEQGTRAFGAAVGPLFPWYYGIQAVCAVLAVASAFAWSSTRKGEKVHTVRTVVLALALVTVGVGWWLEREVSALRVERVPAMNAVLSSDSPTEEEIDRAVQTRATFARWHTYSLLDNFLTVVLVGVGMALCAHLPTTPVIEEPKETED